MSETIHLALPYIAASQAQKHVTHNEALRMLDALVMLSVKDRDLSAPPGAPDEGDRYVVNPAGSGGFAGKDNQIAHYRDGAWEFLGPQAGWTCFVADENALIVFDGAAWVPLLQDIALLGLGTLADAVNPFSAKLNSALWTARYDSEGGDGSLRYTLNKEDAADTLSMLFQTGWSGRAEIGLIGDDKLRVKVSADGSEWKDAAVVDEATGYVGIGTAAPEAALHVVTTGTATAQPILQMFATTTSASGFRFQKARGAPGAPTAAQNNDNVGAFPIQAYDGSNFINVGNFRWVVDGAPSVGNVPSRIELLNCPDGGALVTRLAIESAGATRPGVDNAYSCGTSSFRWSAIYAANGTIQTSDARLKTGIADSNLGLDFINALRPVSYRWIVGGQQVAPDRNAPADEDGNPASRTVSRPGLRTHYGLIAQEVKAALDAAGHQDFGGYIKTDVTDPESEEGLRYDQFIAPLIRAVQELTERVASLEEKCTACRIIPSGAVR